MDFLLSLCPCNISISIPLLPIMIPFLIMGPTHFPRGTIFTRKLQPKCRQEEKRDHIFLSLFPDFLCPATHLFYSIDYRQMNKLLSSWSDNVMFKKRKICSETIQSLFSLHIGKLSLRITLFHDSLHTSGRISYNAVFLRERETFHCPCNYTSQGMEYEF